MCPRVPSQVRTPSLQANHHLNPEAMPEAKRRFLVVSIHDVSPYTWRPVQGILDALEGIGISKRSLLVIPNHKGMAAIDRAEPEFQAWLIARSQQDEVCLHGYEHQAKALRGGALARLVASVYTDREGEFYQLDNEEAASLLRQGLRHFESLGIQPSGFVAPAWLLNPAVEAALRESGLRYTTRLRSIDILTDSIGRLRAPTLCYSVRSGWRRTLSRLWNPALFRLERHRPILRAAVHPPDLDHPAIFRQILGLLRRACEDRIVATYQEVVEYYLSRTEHTE